MWTRKGGTDLKSVAEDTPLTVGTTVFHRYGTSERRITERGGKPLRDALESVAQPILKLGQQRFLTKE